MRLLLQWYEVTQSPWGALAAVVLLVIWFVWTVYKNRRKDRSNKG